MYYICSEFRRNCEGGRLSLKTNYKLLERKLKLNIHQQTPEVRDMEEGQSTTYHKNLDC